MEVSVILFFCGHFAGDKSNFKKGIVDLKYEDLF